MIVDEGRKRVLLIAASILAARKLAQYEPSKLVPATVSAVADSVRWAERIMDEIDRRHPVASSVISTRVRANLTYSRN
jgi:hypothetical protein